MSQMLVRIDKEIDEALTHMYNNEGMASLLSQYELLSDIAMGIYKQWKPNHEAMLKLKDEEKKNAKEKE